METTMAKPIRRINIIKKHKFFNDINRNSIIYKFDYHLSTVKNEWWGSGVKTSDGEVV